MSTFKNILVPTDFGEHAEHAAEVALSIAKDNDAKLVLVHVFEPLAYYGYGGSVYFPMSDFLAEAQKSLDAAVARMRERYPRCDGVLASGSASDRILGVVEEQHADLVVMGTHGRRGLSHVFLGSIAEKVVRRSPVPVLTVGRPGDTKAAPQAAA